MQKLWHVLPKNVRSFCSAKASFNFSAKKTTAVDFRYFTKSMQVFSRGTFRYTVTRVTNVTIGQVRRLHWYGHVERSNGAVKTAFDIQVNGKRGPGRPKMTWKQLTERDRRQWKLSAIDPHDGDTWRSGVRSAMRAASQLPRRGPTVVDMVPIPAI